MFQNSCVENLINQQEQALINILPVYPHQAFIVRFLRTISHLIGKIGFKDAPNNHFLK
jgi:hypothetical protein